MSDLPACTPGHLTPIPGTEGGRFGDNHDRDCLSVYQADEDGQDEQVLHICDWPAFKAAGDKHQRERGGQV